MMIIVEKIKRLGDSYKVGCYQFLLVFHGINGSVEYVFGIVSAKLYTFYLYKTEQKSQQPTSLLSPKIIRYIK